MILCGLFPSPMIFKPGLKLHVRNSVDSIYKNTKKNYKNHSETETQGVQKRKRF